jgi:ribonuclease HII
VILKEKTRLPGLNDSKKLSASKREELFDLITKQALDYSISIVSHITIDEINILEATKLANFHCVENLELRPDIILIDGRDKQIIAEPHQCVIKGDSKVRCIAAASILAKVTRDRIMDYYAEKFPNYEFQSHMGYGTRQHRDLIHKHGHCEIHRKSFKIKST